MTADQQSNGQAVKEQAASMWNALSIAWEVGYIIAIPAFLFGFAGAYIDKQYDLSPIFTILGILLALVISGFTIWRRIQSILSRL